MVDEPEKTDTEENYKLAPEHPNDLNEKQDAHFLGVPKTLARKASDDSFMSPNDPSTAHLNGSLRDRLMSVAGPMNFSSEDLRRQELRAERLDQDQRSINDQPSTRRKRRQYSTQHKTQDIEEVWFSGGHADIGGGWSRSAGEKWMLSHAPLVWMVNEAVKAGLEFDPM